MGVEIKCPFCGNMFDPSKAQKIGDSGLDTVIKGALFLPWGIHSAAKGRGIRCPHCKMIIKQ